MVKWSQKNLDLDIGLNVAKWAIPRFSRQAANSAVNGKFRGVA